MTPVLQKERFLADTPAHSPPALVVERALVPEGLLDNDEIVLLAVKPSLWFILLRSGSWLVAAAGVAALTWWLGRHGFHKRPGSACRNIAGINGQQFRELQQRGSLVWGKVVNRQSLAPGFGERAGQERDIFHRFQSRLPGHFDAAEPCRTPNGIVDGCGSRKEDIAAGVRERNQSQVRIREPRVI